MQKKRSHVDVTERTARRDETQNEIRKTTHSENRIYECADCRLLHIQNMMAVPNATTERNDEWILLVWTSIPSGVTTYPHPRSNTIPCHTTLHPLLSASYGEYIECVACCVACSISNSDPNNARQIRTMYFSNGFCLFALSSEHGIWAPCWIHMIMANPRATDATEPIMVLRDRDFILFKPNSNAHGNVIIFRIAIIFSPEGPFSHTGNEVMEIGKTILDQCNVYFVCV